MTSNIQHFQHFIRKEGYHESLTPPQQIDCYAKAYPGRVNPLLVELMDERVRGQILAEGEANFWFYSVREIVDWVERGVEPSEPLSSILQNDLFKAVGYVDSRVAHHLCRIVHHLMLWLPPDCYGSADMFEAWKGEEAVEFRATVLNNWKGWEQCKRQMQEKV